MRLLSFFTSDTLTLHSLSARNFALSNSMSESEELTLATSWSSSGLEAAKILAADNIELNYELTDCLMTLKLYARFQTSYMPRVPNRMDARTQGRNSHSHK